MYTKSGDTIYKTSLIGFTRDFKKISGSEKISHNIGKWGMMREMAQMETEEKKIFDLLIVYQFFIYCYCEICFIICHVFIFLR